MRPIGVIDSGVGGLTVAMALRDVCPREDLLYFGDSAYNPYGSLSDEMILKRTEHMIEYLLEREAKMIVIACNTISFAVGKRLREEYPVPIIGMDPFCVLEGDERQVAVLATPVTIGMHAHREAIMQRYPDAMVHEVACDELAAAIEQNDSERTQQLIHSYARDISEVDVAIWGCTHYPLAAVWWHQAMPTVRFVNPAMRTAKIAAKVLLENGLESRSNGTMRGIFSGHHVPSVASELLPQVAFELE